MELPAYFGFTEALKFGQFILNILVNLYNVFFVMPAEDAMRLLLRIAVAPIDAMLDVIGLGVPELLIDFLASIVYALPANHGLLPLGYVVLEFALYVAILFAVYKALLYLVSVVLELFI